MALRLVVGEPDDHADVSAWMPVLERISAAAARDQAAAVVSAAAVLGDTLRAAAQAPVGEGRPISALLQEGVANLQKAMESPSQGTPPQNLQIALDPELISDFIVE